MNDGSNTKNVDKLKLEFSERIELAQKEFIKSVAEITANDNIESKSKFENTK
jgi:hypothetical protein